MAALAAAAAVAGPEAAKAARAAQMLRMYNCPWLRVPVFEPCTVWRESCRLTQNAVEECSGIAFSAIAVPDDLSCMPLATCGMWARMRNSVQTMVFACITNIAFDVFENLLHILLLVAKRRHWTRSSRTIIVSLACLCFVGDFVLPLVVIMTAARSLPDLEELSHSPCFSEEAQYNSIVPMRVYFEDTKIMNVVMLIFGLIGGLTEIGSEWVEVFAGDLETLTHVSLGIAFVGLIPAWGELTLSVADFLNHLLPALKAVVGIDQASANAGGLSNYTCEVINPALPPPHYQPATDILPIAIALGCTTAVLLIGFCGALGHLCGKVVAAHSLHSQEHVLDADPEEDVGHTTSRRSSQVHGKRTSRVIRNSRGGAEGQKRKSLLDGEAAYEELRMVETTSEAPRSELSVADEQHYLEMDDELSLRLGKEAAAPPKLISAIENVDCASSNVPIEKVEALEGPEEKASLLDAQEPDLEAPPVEQPAAEEPEPAAAPEPEAVQEASEAPAAAPPAAPAPAAAAEAAAPWRWMWQRAGRGHCARCPASTMELEGELYCTPVEEYEADEAGATLSVSRPRLQAIVGLVAQQKKANDVVSKLEVALQGDEEEDVRVALTRAMVAVGTKAVLNTLCVHLRNRDAGVRRRAAEGLGHMGAKASSAEADLQALADDENEVQSVREAAEAALNGIRGHGPAPAGP